MTLQYIHARFFLYYVIDTYCRSRVTLILVLSTCVATLAERLTDVLDVTGLCPPAATRHNTLHTVD